ncbi:MAG: hypothetical protein ABTQ25_10540 [Nitrosomonas ureae]
MTDNVVMYSGITKLDLNADRVLLGAVDRGLKDVVIIGYDDDGEFYFSSSKADGGLVIYLLEMAKKKLLEIGDE